MSACSMSWTAYQRAALIALVSGVVLIGAAACQKPASNSEKNGITSRAITTEQRQDGTRVVRQSTPQEVSALDFLAKATDKVDQEFPAPPLNPNMALFRVLAVDSDGTISLEKGESIKLDGVRCTSVGLQTILQMFKNDDQTRIGLVEPAFGGADPTPVEAWLVEDSEPRTFSRLQDLAITSGWCGPEETKSSRYYERYVALMKVREEYVKRFGSNTGP
jgi:hypothetical protein